MDLTRFVSTSLRGRKTSTGGASPVASTSDRRFLRARPLGSTRAIGGTHLTIGIILSAMRDSR